MRVAAIQTTAGTDRDGQPGRRRRAWSTRRPPAAPTLVVLPEYFSVAGTPDVLRAGAEPLDGPTVHLGVATAAAPRDPSGGRQLPGADPGAAGRPAGQHQLPGRPGRRRRSPSTARSTSSTSPCAGVDFRESDTVAPGTRSWWRHSTAAATGRPAAVLGLSLCYDVRFPELYRMLALAGPRWSPCRPPSPRPPGPAHWELLLRARAVEDQVFVIGAGQVGELPPGMPRCHGHSMVVDPWGTVLAERADPSPGVVVADLDLAELDEVRSPPAGAGEPPARRLPWTAWRHEGHHGRRPDGRRRSRVLRAPEDLPDDNPGSAAPYEVGQFVHDNLELYYEVHGQGPRVLVFLHGILMDANMNRRLASDLAAKGNRVILLDLPGHGLSARPSGPRSTAWTPTPAT